jgi:ribosome-associated translation inhibitor RaiA
MELTIGSLSFYIGPSGSTRLSNPVKSGPSTSKTKTITMSGSSVGSSSEVNSPVSLAATEKVQKKLEEFNETQEKIDMEATVVIPHDSPKDFSTESSGVSRSVHQLCVIISEVAEENNHAGNEEVDMQVDKLRSDSKKEKEKIHVSTGEWRIIMSAINHGTKEPADSRREVLMGYQYALHQRRKKLREERDMFMRSRDNIST